MSEKPSLLGEGGRESVGCVCSFCASLFKGYRRWAERGYQPCPKCGLSGTAFVRIVDQEQLRKLLV